MTHNYENCGIGDGKLKPDDVNERITILEDSYEFKYIFQEITTPTGSITTYSNTQIYLDSWAEEFETQTNAIVRATSSGRPTAQEVYDSTGEEVKAVLLADGTYTLSGTPVVTDYAILWFVFGKTKDLALIPENVIIIGFSSKDLDIWTDDGTDLKMTIPRNLDLQDKGLKDDNVITAVKLGSPTDVALNTTKKDLLGGINEVNLNDISTSGTGTLWGLEVSINALDDSTFDVAEGEYRIVNTYSDRENPTYTKIYFAGATGVSITLIVFTNITFLALDINGNIIQRVEPLIFKDERDFNTIGILTHKNRVNIDDATSIGNIIPDFNLAFADFLSCIGRVNCNGNGFSANGNNLKINKDSGTMYGAGINYGGTNKSSYMKQLLISEPATFLLTKKVIGPSTFIETDLIPTDLYDKDGAGVLVDIPIGNFVNHRILIAPSINDIGLILVQYGQFAYDTLKKAVDSFEQEEFEYADELASVHTRTILSVEQGTTDLSDLKKAKFSNLGMFGAEDFKKTKNYSRFSSAINVVAGLSNSRQEISFVESGGVLYSDISKAFSYERDDISFIASDSSINTTGGDFNNGSVQISDKIVISGSVNNNGIFNVVSKTTLKIVVNEAIIDESAGGDIEILTFGVGDIIYNFDGREYVLDCTTGTGVGGRARIALTQGTDTAPQENWVYVIENNDEAILQQSSTEPSEEFAMVFSAFIPSVATSLSDGFYNSRRWSDVKDLEGRGVIATILSKLRDEKLVQSGLGATITIDTVPTPDSVDFTVDAGIIREIYDQIVVDLQLSVNGALVVNDPTTPYKEIFDLNEITVDSTGTSLNNKYFQITGGISLNTDGHPDRLLLLLPNGFYLNADNAFKDVDGFSNTTFPSSFKSVYLLFAGVFKLTGGNVWTNEALAFGVNNIDLRNKLQGATSSGTGSVSVVHNDTTGKQGGVVGEYYHLDAQDYTDISANTQLAELGTDGDPSFNTITSSVAIGTPPLVITSTTLVSNLNSDLLDSQEGSYYLDSANFTGTNWTDLTDAGDSALHYHSTDRARANHTGTQTASTISDFDTEVSNNTDVSANTTHRGLTTGNPHQVSQSDVGLGNVDNTSDADKPVSTAQQTALDLKADDNAVVHLTGNESIDGIKTFTSFSITPSSAPTTDYQVANKKYVDDSTGAIVPVSTQQYSMLVGGASSDWVEDTNVSLNAGALTINELIVDNININGNSIISTDTNGDIILDPNGTGKMKIVSNELLSYITSDLTYPIVHQYSSGHDDIRLYFDSYFDGAEKSSDAGSNYRFLKIGDQFYLQYSSGNAQGGGVAWSTAFRLNTSGEIDMPSVYSDTVSTSPKILSIQSDGQLGESTTASPTFATLTATTINAFSLGGKLTGGANEIEGSNFDINGGDLSAITISGGLTWSSAQDFNSQALTNVNIDSGIIEGVSRIQVEFTSLDIPDITFLNISPEDPDGGRRSKIDFRGTQTGSEESTLARIQAQHDGASDDQKGELIFYTNDGSDGDSPTERMRIDSAGLTTITGALQVDNININGNSIISTDTNGDINLEPNGTGKVYTSKKVGFGETSVHSNFRFGVESNGGGWDGGAYFGDTTGNKVVMGEIDGVAKIGGHNSALSAWSALYIGANTAAAQTYIPRVYNTPVVGGRDVYVQSTGQLTYNTSAREAKINIMPLENWNNIYNLEPVQFNARKKLSEIRKLELTEEKNDDGTFKYEENTWTEKYRSETIIGLIADDVLEYFPEVVWKEDILDETGEIIGSKIAGLDYKALISPIIKCIQEQKKTIEDLKKRVEELEKNVA